MRIWSKGVKDDLERKILQLQEEQDGLDSEGNRRIEIKKFTLYLYF